MSRDKQIEEMAVEFAKINCNPKGCYNCNLCDEYGSLELNCEDYLSYRTMAETFYNAGYRKSTDVARDIFAEIEKETNTYEVPFSNGEIKGLIVMAIDKEDYNSIKKKYTVTDTNVGGKDTESEKDTGEV